MTQAIEIFAQRPKIVLSLFSFIFAALDGCQLRRLQRRRTRIWPEHLETRESLAHRESLVYLAHRESLVYRECKAEPSSRP